jgi:hypothetical protein
VLEAVVSENRTGQVWEARDGEVYLIVRPGRLLKSYTGAVFHHAIKLVSGARCTLVESPGGEFEERSSWTRL